MPSRSPSLVPVRPIAVACALQLAGLLAGCAPLYAPVSSTSLGPASLDPGSPQARAVGCWAIDWSAAEAGASFGGGELPDSIGLEDAPLLVGRGWVVSPATQPAGRGFGAEAATGEVPWEQRFRANRWTVDGDAVEIVFSEAPAAHWSLRLREDGEGLAGVAGYFESTDPEDAVRSVEVRVERIDCLTDAQTLPRFPLRG